MGIHRLSDWMEYGMGEAWAHHGGWVSGAWVDGVMRFFAECDLFRPCFFGGLVGRAGSHGRVLLYVRGFD
jgi:hypothetical protein